MGGDRCFSDYILVAVSEVYHLVLSPDYHALQAGGVTVWGRDYHHGSIAVCIVCAK